MKLIFFVIFFIALAHVSGKWSFHFNFTQPQDFYETHFEPILKSGKATAEHFLEKLKKYSKEALKGIEEKMSDEVALDFFHKHKKNTDDLSDTIVKKILAEFNEYAPTRVRNIYEELLALYELDKESEEVLEMIFKEPEYYGLTYESWKIMTFAKELEKDLGHKGVALEL